MEIEDNLELFFYSRREVSDGDLQFYLRYLHLYDMELWLLALDEKLRRVELEISIK